jgi:hypothetical protein
MSVRKRISKNASGTHEAWVVNYRDKAKGGTRVQRTFRLKKEADDFATTMKGEVRDGIHIARSKSVTVADAGKEWIKTAEVNVECATVANYRAVLTFHIVPFLGSEKVSPPAMSPAGSVPIGSAARSAKPSAGANSRSA